MWNIKYKDVPLNARGDSVTLSETAQSFSNMELFGKEVYTPPKYATVERDYWLLDGNLPVMDADTEEVAYCSICMSNADGVFEAPPAVTRTYGHYYSSVGVTMCFDVNSGDCVSQLNIKWYADDELLAEKEFYPDSEEYFCENVVELYNKVVITFKKTSKPYRYAKVTKIFDGIMRTITDSELTSLSVLEEVSEDGSELAINTLKFDVAVTNAQYLFQKAQPIDLYNGNELYANFFLKKSSQKSRFLFSAECEDAVGFLDGSDFHGGIYTGQTVSSVVDEIMSGEMYEYWIDDNVKDFKLYGYIPYSSKRKSLQQICFAARAVCDTSRNGRIEIYRPSDKSISIPDSNVIKGGKITTGDYVTKVKITEHNYYLEGPQTSVYSKTVYVGKNIVIFDKPVDPETITTNSSEYGIITEKSNNHLVLESNDEFKLEVSAKVYEDYYAIRVFENKRVPYGSAEIEKKVENATLVGKYNIDDIAENIFKIYTHNKKIETDLIVDNYRCGDCVKIKTEWDGEKTAQILKLDSDIKNNMYAKAVLKING